ADPGRIRIAYRGIESLRIATDGSLLIRTAFGDLHESAHRIYQEIGGKRVEVRGRFKLLGETAYTFEIDAYHPRYALVIDPTLIYSRYLGGSTVALGSRDVGLAIDGAGSAYIAGTINA